MGSVLIVPVMLRTGFYSKWQKEDLTSGEKKKKRIKDKERIEYPYCWLSAWVQAAIEMPFYQEKYLAREYGLF